MSHVCDGWSVNPHKCKRVCCHFFSFFFFQNPITHAVAQVNSLSLRLPSLELYIIGHVFGWRVPHTCTRALLPSEGFYLFGRDPEQHLPSAAITCLLIVCSLPLFHAHFTVCLCTQTEQRGPVQIATWVFVQYDEVNLYLMSVCSFFLKFWVAIVWF